MQKLQIGVIGTGHMGRNHVRNLADEKRFDLVGIYDANETQAKEIAELYETTAFSSLEELLDAVEAVVVAVPSSLHKEVGLKVAEKKVHALIEKPLATNSEDAREIAEAFQRNGLKLQVGHIERFNAVVTELSKILDGKKIFYVEAHRYSPFSGSGRITDTSVIEDLMIHDIDIVCSIMEPKTVTDIRGNGEKIRSNATDFATCMLDFSSNAHAIINASRVSQNKERSLEIHTEDAIVYADLLAKTLTITKNTDIMIESDHAGTYKQDAVVQKVFVPIIEPLRAELQSFYEAVVNDEKILVDGVTAIRAIEICEQVVKRANYEA